MQQALAACWLDDVMTWRNEVTCLGDLGLFFGCWWVIDRGEGRGDWWSTAADALRIVRLQHPPPLLVFQVADGASDATRWVPEQAGAGYPGRYRPRVFATSHSRAQGHLVSVWTHPGIDGRPAAGGRRLPEAASEHAGSSNEGCSKRTIRCSMRQLIACCIRFMRALFPPVCRLFVLCSPAVDIRRVSEPAANSHVCTVHQSSLCLWFASLNVHAPPPRLYALKISLSDLGQNVLHWRGDQHLS